MSDSSLDRDAVYRRQAEVRARLDNDNTIRALKTTIDGQRRSISRLTVERDAAERRVRDMAREIEKLQRENAALKSGGAR